MSTPSSTFLQSEYRPDIDGLRAVAVLLVIGFHFFPDVFKGGFVGVDIFFVISGYLISSIIIKNINASTFSFSIFYARRIRRIFPALLFVLILSTAFSYIFLYESELVHFAKYLVAGLFFVSDFLSWAESGYFDVSSYDKPLLHLWSLGVEEQFYIVWPLILVAAAKKKVRLLLLISLLTVMSFLTNICIAYGDSIAAFYSPITRFWELLIGGVIATLEIFYKFEAKLHVGIRKASSSFGFLLLISSLFFIKPTDVFPGWWAILPVGSAIFIILAGHHGFINRNFLANSILVRVGLISYPLYLWHWPLISFASLIYIGMPSVGMRILLIIITFILAWITYSYIEKPIRNFKNISWRLPFAPTLLMCASIMGILGVATYLNHQIVTQPIVVKVPSLSSDKILLVGDSHADHLFLGLTGEFGGAILNKSMPSCLPLFGLDTFSVAYKPKRCFNAVNEIYNSTIKRPDIKLIVLSSMGPVYLTGNPFAGLGIERTKGLQLFWDADPSIVDRWEMYELAMRESFKRLMAANKKVIFVIDVPELGVEPKYCNANEAEEKRNARLIIPRRFLSCSVDRALYDARTKRYKKLVYKVASEFSQVIIFDPTDMFCDASVCSGVRDGNILYKDSDHLSNYGSIYIAKKLAITVRGILSSD